MVLAFAIPDALWGSVTGALLGSLIATGIVAYLTQRWIERRELRSRRDDLRLELYLEVIDLVLKNELAIAERGAEGNIPPVKLQTKRLRIGHRLKLLASRPVNEAYNRYRELVFQETANGIAYRPKRASKNSSSGSWADGLSSAA
jgi:hypothetical protein